MSKRKSQFYAGENVCTGVLKNGKSCTQKAYYMLNGSLKCGRHANTKTKRVKLKKNPMASKIRENELAAHKKTIKDARKRNLSEGRRGKITAQKMRMMRNPCLTDGVLLIFPNNKHQNRRDGFGCAALSPMRLGPVSHGQPGVPDSLTIENYHQFNKVFSIEQDDDGNPLPIFFEKRNAAYVDPIPHRHKYDSTNTPMYSIHLDANGVERRYTYVQSRFFYCHFYEMLAKQENVFKMLQNLVVKGTNIEICGYDAYNPAPSIDGLYQHYCDATRPFGHELVLYCLLLIDNVEDYPWNRFYRKHSDLYDPLSFK